MIRNKVIREDFEEIFSRNVDWNKLHGKTVFVTGAYGMLASYIVWFLIWLRREKGIDVCLLLQGHSAKKLRARFGEYEDENIILTDIDILHPISLDRKPDYIIHAAGLANPSYYNHMPIEVAEANAVGTYHLLNLAAASGTSSFLFFSTCDVYGQFETSGQMIHEEVMGTVDPLDPHSCYNESKRMGETWCQSFWRERQVPAKMARIAHTYSPTMDIENDPRVFASFMKNIVQGQNIVMHSDGSSFRAYCYIADALVGLFLILFNGADGEAYNVCNSEQFVSVSALAEEMTRLDPALNLQVERKQRASGNYLEAAYNKAIRYSDSKLKALGWQCEYDIHKGFLRVYHYFCTMQKSV